MQIFPILPYVIQMYASFFLSLFFLFQIRGQSGEDRRIPWIGFSAFLCLTLWYFIVATGLALLLFFGVTLPIVVSFIQHLLFGAGFILLAIWVLAITCREWVCAHKRVIAITGLVGWGAYLGARVVGYFIPNLNLVMSLVFTTTVFVFALSFALLKTRENRTAIMLFAGLLLFYLNRLFRTYPLIQFAVFPFYEITFLGLWLILIFCLVSEK